MNTVVVLEAGMGALSLGFKQAGFQVTAAFEKNERAAAIYERNMKDQIDRRGLLELSPEEIPEADVIAADLTSAELFKRKESSQPKGSGISSHPLDKMYEIIRKNTPQAFCLVLPAVIHRVPAWSEFLGQLSELEYQFEWKVINTREMTELPVSEKRVYMVGSRLSGCTVKFIKDKEKGRFSIRRFAGSRREDDWYYKIDQETIQESGDGRDCFFCWRKDKYVERPYVDWNVVKPALIRVDGEIRKLTYNEMAKLKGFPDRFELDLTNKAWIFRALVYSPNVLVVRSMAKCLKYSLPQTSLEKMQAPDREFEKLFEDYLNQQGGELKIDIDHDRNQGIDMIYTYGDVTYCFQMKYYRSDNGVERNLRRLCSSLSENSKMEQYRRILVTANLVKDELKRLCSDKFGISVWDVKNLLWIFDEFAEIKNEFVALLNYSVEAIQPEEPAPPIFRKPEEKPECNRLKEKLERIKPGKEQYQEYQDLCVEILKYVLGDYLTLWDIQEKTDGGMYRFDLCCKIKDGVNEDFFNTVRQYFGTKYIVFEFKNYTDQITQKEIYTTEKYLYEKALRKVAVIISRRGPSESALAAARGSFRENGKLILCLSDKDIMDLIDIKEKDQRSTGSFFETMLDNILIHLEK